MKRTIFMALFFLLSGSAYGQGGYAGVGLGGSHMSIDTPQSAGVTVEVDENDMSWQVFGGYQFNKLLGVEVAYGDFGTFGTRGSSFGSWAEETHEVDAFSLSAIWNFPLKRGFSLFGETGLAQWTMEHKVESNILASSSRSISGTTPVLGFGGQFSLDRFLFRAQIEHYLSVGDNETGEGNLINVGVSASVRF